MRDSLKFKVKISKLGKRWIINIPNALYEELTPYLDKELLVEIREK